MKFFFKKIQMIFIIIQFIGLNSCKKQDSFLNSKPNDALTVPTSLANLQDLLNNARVFNLQDPGLGEISSDDYYVPLTILNSQTTQERNGYTWAKQVYDAGADVSDWSGPYQQIYTANTALDYLLKISYPSSQQAQADKIKGTALFYRSIAFYNLLQTFTLPYDSKTASNDLGIPIRLNSDLNIKSTRATNQQCYDQIINDLKTALTLLPKSPIYITQPGQPAANALLARVYLALGDNANALKYANDCLNQFNTLTDYNTLTPNSRTISTKFLNEDIFHSCMVGYVINLTGRYSITDSILYKSYSANDLRKSVFFTITNGLPYFRGNYDYKRNVYDGIATDEVYLIRAETNARLGNVTNAMGDLNTLLKNRWLTGTFVPYSAISADDALKQILIERRKELLYRGIRWADLRRLNKESRFAITLTRNLNNSIYTLPPNDSRYAWPIPDDEIQLSGIQQNAR